MNGYFNEPWMDKLNPCLLERYWRHKGGQEPVLIWIDYRFTVELWNDGYGEINIARPKPPRAYYDSPKNDNLNIRRRAMYKIVITEKTLKELPHGKEWKQVGEKADGSSKYDYTPEIIKAQEDERVLLKQELDELDLAAVIRAVNGL